MGREFTLVELLNGYRRLVGMLLAVLFVREAARRSLRRSNPRQIDAALNDLSQDPEHQQLLANLRRRLRALRENAR